MNNNNNKKRNTKKTSGKRNGRSAPRKDVTNSIRTGLIPVYTFQRTSQFGINCGNSGFIPAVGLVPFTRFTIWYTPQSAYLWSNASNYTVVSMPGYTDLAALFDEVMIESVEMSIYTTNLEGTVNVGSALMLLITDYNDKNAPASNDDVLQYQDCKAIPILSQFPYKEKQNPKMLSYTLDSAGISQPSMPVKGFVRSNLDVEHFCRKGCLLQAPSGTQTWNFVFRYTYKCRVCK